MVVVVVMTMMLEHNAVIIPRPSSLSLEDAVLSPRLVCLHALRFIVIIFLGASNVQNKMIKNLTI